MTDTERIGHDLGIEHACHGPLVVLEDGTVSFASQKRGSLLIGELSGRNVILGDMAVAVGPHERLQLGSPGELRPDLLHVLLQSEQIVVGRLDLEDDIRERTRRQLPECVLMLLIISLDVAVGNMDERIGDRRILLAEPPAGELVVGSLDAAGDLERISEGTAAHQSGELAGSTLETCLLVELLPSKHGLRIGLGVGEETADDGDVINPCTRVGESLVEDGRILLAGDHGLPLLLGNPQTGLLETGREDPPGDEGLPGGIGEQSGLLLVALLGAGLLADLLVDVVILGIGDLRAVDFTDLGVVARKTHVVPQRENESQEGEGDDDRKHDAELGA